MKSDFIPKDSLDILIKRWWVVIIFAIFGGIVGQILHFFIPPIYETQASMGISIDYSRTGLLTDIEEDQIFGTIADVFSTDIVLKNVIEEANNQNITIDKSLLKRIVIHERTDNTWLFKAQYTDPEIASQLANIWIVEAYNALDEAYEHTLIAEGYQRYIDSLTDCLQQFTVVQPTHSYCSINNLFEIQDRLTEVTQLEKIERQKSLGINPGVSFRIDSKAVIPQKPTRHHVNTLIFSGSIIGFIFGLWFVNVKETQSIGKLQ